MKPCSNCGSELPDDAAYCQRCGRSTAVATPPSTTPPLPPGAPGPAPAPPPPPPGSQSRARTSTLTPPPPTPLSGRTVAIVAAVVVLVVAGSVVFLFTRGGGAAEPPPPSPLPESTPSGQMPPEMFDEDPDQEPPPDSSGRLADLLPERVADFTLVDVVVNDNIAELGATGGIAALYRASDGVELFHELFAFASEADARDALALVADILISNEYEAAGSREDSGGRLEILVNQNNQEAALFNRDGLLATIGAPIGRGSDFFNDLSYGGG